MKFYWFILIILLLSSCVTRRACERKFPPQIKKDSIFIKTTEVVYRDTIVYIQMPADTMYINDTVWVTQEGVQSDTIKSDLLYSFASAWVLNSKINLFHRTKDTIIKRVIENAIKEAETTEQTIVKEVQIKEVRLIPWWAKVLMFLSIPTILYILFRIFKLLI